MTGFSPEERLPGPVVEKCPGYQCVCRDGGCRGERLGRVSSEWFLRPDDERFLSLPELYATVHARAQRVEARTVESRAIRVEARRDDGERLALIVPGQEQPVAPTHWSFGQRCGLVGAPAGYLRELPAPLAGINLQHGLLKPKEPLHNIMIPWQF